ncbi:hypothetical protein NKH77_05355 [Streptomyces sp. M19]
MFTVDTHTHIISPDTGRYPRPRSAVTAPPGPRSGPPTSTASCARPTPPPSTASSSSRPPPSTGSTTATWPTSSPGTPTASAACARSTSLPDAVRDLRHWIDERASPGPHPRRRRDDSRADARPRPRRRTHGAGLAVPVRPRVPVCVQMHAQHAPPSRDSSSGTRTHRDPGPRGPTAAGRGHAAVPRRPGVPGSARPAGSSSSSRHRPSCARGTRPDPRRPWSGR